VEATEELISSENNVLVTDVTSSSGDKSGPASGGQNYPATYTHYKLVQPTEVSFSIKNGNGSNSGDLTITTKFRDRSDDVTEITNLGSKNSTGFSVNVPDNDRLDEVILDGTVRAGYFQIKIDRPNRRRVVRRV
jgi:hypothetical protein